MLLSKGAVEEVISRSSPGFYGRIFVVPKSSGGWRPVLDLSALNRFLRILPFRMESTASIRDSIHRGDWATSIDLSDACFHILIHPRDRKWLRFLWRGRTFSVEHSPLAWLRLLGFHEGREGALPLSASEGHPHQGLPRRLAHPGRLSGSLQRPDSLSLEPLPFSGLHPKPPEVGALPIPTVPFPGDSIRYSEVASPTSGAQGSKAFLLHLSAPSA